MIKAGSGRGSTTYENVKGQGGVDYLDPIVHIVGAGGDYAPSGGADFKSAQFELLQRPARGSAESMNLTPEGILDLKQVTFTTCPANDQSWSLNAKSITLNTQTKIGEVHDAKSSSKASRSSICRGQTFRWAMNARAVSCFPPSATTPAPA